MFDIECIIDYKKAFPDSSLGMDEPTGRPCVYSDDEDIYKIAPNDETTETILNRIERSKKAGRNLFYEEWEDFVPDPDVIY